MSELTRCNRCTLSDIEKHAQQTGRKVTLLPSTFAGSGKVSSSMSGTTVLVHGLDEEPDAEKHWAAWLWVISEECVC